MKANLNNSPFFSVIVNCLNGERYLRKALDSIFSQTFDDYEVIFWDSKSTDRSPEIAKSYSDSRLNFFSAPKVTNLSEARNLAVKQAIGNWIAFLDCDDVWLPQKLEKQYEIIRRNNSHEIGFIYTRAKVINENGDWIQTRRDVQALPSGYIMKDLLEENHVAIASSVVRKEYFLKIGGIANHYSTCGDYYLWLALSKKWKALNTEETLTLIRSHSENLTLRNRKKMAIESSRLRLHFDSTYSLFRFGFDLYLLFKPIILEVFFPFHFRVKLRVKNHRKLFIWGASQLGRESIHYLQKKKIYPYRFLDKDPNKHGKNFEGFCVESPSLLGKFNQKNKPFVVIASMYKHEIASELIHLGYHENKDFSHFPF